MIGFYKAPTSDGTGIDTTTAISEVLAPSHIQVDLAFTEPVKLYDQVVINFPSSFDLSSVTSVYSVFHGEGTVYNRELWTSNLFKGVWPEDTAY